MIAEFKPFSLGYVLANKKPGSKIVDVIPVEHFPAVDGEITASVEEIEVTGMNPDGSKYSLKMENGTSIPATWLPFSSNRVTAPDVRRRERVMIYQFGDTNQYYWVPLGLDDHLRRLETVIYAFNADPDINSDGELDFTKCYYFEVSTRTKNVTFSTSKANGEPFAYTTQYNCAEGIVTTTDDDNNFMELNSKERKLLFHNGDGTFAELSRKIINLFAPDAINVVAKNLIEFTTKLFRVVASEKVVITTPMAQFSKDVEIAGNATVGKQLQAGGISTTGKVQAGTINCGSIRAGTYENLPR